MALFLMPSLGADMESGKLVEWLKRPGEAVHSGDIVAVVETEKGAIEIESFQEGTFQRQLVEVGGIVPVGAPLAEIDGGAALSPESSRPKREEHVPAPPRAAPEAIAAPALPATGRVKITPAAKQRALALGTDLSRISGTGPSGEIVLADVIKHPPAIQAAESGGLTGMRAAIAAAMSRSKREIPHYYLSHHIDITPCETLITEMNANRPAESRILLAALLVRAVALAAKKHPQLNGHFVNGAFVLSEPIHAGFAINIRGGGLVAPAIHNAHALSVDELMLKIRDLVTRVRAGRFRSTELSDPTITISSLGERGVETLYGVIYPPQVAIVGFGAPVARPWIAGAGIETRRVMSVTLAADHRVSDGHAGSQFLSAISSLLENPESLK
jgi:pyruvate dehydrogenase E2 component (dihydrolipoamide acetyltransferase)